MSKKYNREYEVGYTPTLVMEEATRCLLCLDAPCSKACPAGTDPAKFIRSVRFRNIKGAAETVRINNVLGAICARVCPTERYCQNGCSRSGIDKPIDIGRIQRYITDHEDALGMNILEKVSKNGKNVAVIGSGPGGLSTAGYLALKGFDVTIFEKEEKAGGYLRYGIPEYRLPNTIVDKEIERIEALGVKIVCQTRIGTDITVEQLREDFDAVVVAIGSNMGKVLDMFKDNENVVTAVDFLKEVKTKKGDVKLPNNVLVIGGGDVAMDVVTTLKLLGVKNVSDVVYEEFDEFKASKKELLGAQENNVSIIDGYVPVSINDKTVQFKHRVIDANLTITANLIILAIGQVVDAKGINLDFVRGEVDIKDVQVPGTNVFVAGDISHGEKTVVYAVKSGKEVADAVASYLGGK